MDQFNIVEKLLGLTLVGAEWVLWLLIGLSVLSLTIVIDRLVYFYRIRNDYSQFSEDLTKHLLSKDHDAITRLCSSSMSLEGQMVLRGLSFKSQGNKAMEGAMESFVAAEKQKLDRGLVVLGTLGNNTPFIGLFGTVIGIIKAFHDLSLHPEGGPGVVMNGISEALVATAIGLLVAIPAVIAFNGFNKFVKRKVSNMQSTLKTVLTLV